MIMYDFDGFSLSVSTYVDPSALTPATGNERDVFFYTLLRDCPTSLGDWYDFTSLIGKPLPTTEHDYREITLYAEFGTTDPSVMPQYKLLDLFEDVLDAGSWEDYFNDYFRETYQNELFDKFCLWNRVYIDRYCVYYHKHDLNYFKAFSTIEQAFYGVPDVALIIGDDYIPIDCSDLNRDGILDALPKDIPDYDKIYDVLSSELPYYVVAD